MTAVDHPLVGSWRLREWAAFAEDGAESRPMGEDVVGLVVYSADGTMVTVLGPRGRSRFVSDDVTGGTDDERIRAFTTFVAYGGPFKIHGDTVQHHVETSLFPNWVGTVQQRRWEVDETGQRLTLSSPPVMLGGVARIHRLTWERTRD